MKNKIMSLIFCSFSLVSCATMSEITPVGKDTYMMAGSSTATGEGGGNLKAKLAKEASGYCLKQGKSLLLVGFSTVDWALGRPASAEITFRCLHENDPEYIRPNANYENSPGGNTSTGFGVLVNTN